MNFLLEKFAHLSKAERWFNGMFWTFAFYLVFFSSGYGFREVLPPLSFIFLCGWWRCNWEHSNLKAFPYKAVLVIFGCFLLESVLFSTNVWASFCHVARGLNKQFMVFFIALECARGAKEIRYLAVALFSGCFLQSLACLWQFYNGTDPFYGYAIIAGRLTGTMAWYWVGNYLVLASIPAWSLFTVQGKKLMYPLLASLPVFFGAIFSAARASLLSACAVLAALLIWKKKISWSKALLGLCLVGIIFTAGLYFFGEGRMSLTIIVNDARFTLWHLSYEVFKTHIFTGVGAWQYRPVLQTLAIASSYATEYVTTSHPHNDYLQILCETGVCGFVMCFGSLWFLFFKSGQSIVQFFKQETSVVEKRFYWQQGFFFWLGVLAFFVHWLVGHDFFRPWYQALFMTDLGVLCGLLALDKKNFSEYADINKKND